MAQAYGIADIFKLDAAQLEQAIELRQQAMVPAAPLVVPRKEYDARLMTKAPSRTSQQADVVELLGDYTARGLHLDFPDGEHWHMSFAKKEDTGTMRMPLRQIILCADKLLK